MTVVIITSSRNGMASMCLPTLAKDPRMLIGGVILSQGRIVNRRRFFVRKLNKLIKIGVLGAINGRRIRSWYTSKRPDIECICRELHVPFYEVPSLNGSEMQLVLKDLNPDVGLSLGNGYIASRIFMIPRLGMLNVHSEILPAYQNAQSIIWPIFCNDPYTGFTIHEISDRIDAGRILYQRRIPIEFQPTLEDTVRHNRMIVEEMIPIALAEVCSNIMEFKSNAMEQVGGGRFTTPNIWQFMRMKRNNRRFYETVSKKISP